MGEKIPFIDHQHGRAFWQAAGALVRRAQLQHVYSVMNPSNVQNLHHGIHWRSHHGDESAKEVTTMQQHQVGHEVRLDDIMRHNLDLVPNTVSSIVSGMQSQLMQQLYTTVHASTEKSGNVVSAKASGSNRQAFLDMLKKIEFGTDEDGNVSLPQMHVGPGNPLFEELQSAGAEFEAEVDAIIREKSEAALNREKERLSRFKV